MLRALSVLYAAAAAGAAVSSAARRAEQAGSCSLAPAGVLLGRGSMAMLAVRNSSACCAACGARAGCVAFSYEQRDSKCYLKDNAAKGKCKHAGCVSGAVATPAPPAPGPAGGTVAATLTINAAAPIARFSQHFLGVNADWWLDGCGLAMGQS